MPRCRWLCGRPDDSLDVAGRARYVTLFPQFARAFGGRAFASRGAHGTGNLAAVALWLPPGVHPDDETLDALMQQTVGPERLAELGRYSSRCRRITPAVRTGICRSSAAMRPTKATDTARHS